MNNKTQRPWGCFEVLREVAPAGTRQGFKVKHLFIDPGKEIHLQFHYHRSENWVIVNGTAEVTIGDRVHVLTAGASIHIGIGEVHKVSNPGKIPVEIIEVQIGAYLEDDDVHHLDTLEGDTP